MILASWLALAAPVTLDADVPQAASSGAAAAVPAAAAATPRNDLRFMAERSAVMSGTTSHPAFWSGGRPSRNGRPRGGVPRRSGRLGQTTFEALRCLGREYASRLPRARGSGDFVRNRSHGAAGARRGDRWTAARVGWERRQRWRGPRRGVAGRSAWA